MKTIKDFDKTKDYLVCIDSDGCAIDSMTIKHKVAFGPAMIETFHLEEYADDLLKEWNRVNLYSKTRGVNRFVGLNILLHYCNDKYKHIENLEDFDGYINNTKDYSTITLIEYMKKHKSSCLDLCLAWSNLTNEKIDNIKEEDINLFSNVKESIKEISNIADIAVVSSANFDAIYNEWNRLGIMQYVDCFCSQDDGAKAFCIHSLLSKGYQSKNVIMIGDAFGDWNAARQNNVYFYPILCKHEDNSWKELIKYIEYIKDNTFGKYEEYLIDSFTNNLKE